MNNNIIHNKFYSYIIVYCLFEMNHLFERSLLAIQEKK